MRKHLIIFFLLPLITYSQSTVTKDLFYPNQKEKPKDPIRILTDTSGWTVIGEYNLYYSKQTEYYSKPGEVKKFKNHKERVKLFRHFYTKVKKNKIIGKGDRKVVNHVVYLDDNTLILEYTTKINIGKNGSPKRKDQKLVSMTFRTLYKRNTK